MSVRAHMRVHTHWCLCMWRSEQDFADFSLVFSASFSLWQGVLVNRKLSILTRLTVQGVLGICLSLPPSWAVTGEGSHAWVFTYVILHRLRASTLTHRAVSRLACFYGLKPPSLWHTLIAAPGEGELYGVEHWCALVNTFFFNFDLQGSKQLAKEIC